MRLQGGNFDTGRGFFAYSPEAEKVDAYIAYDGSYTDGPFQNPGRYRRDNINANYTKALTAEQKIGYRFLFGRNDFYSSGQIPLDLVSQGLLDRFGYINPTDGGRVKLGTASAYYSKAFLNGDTLKADGFVSRSLFDLYSDFTYFLHDPQRGGLLALHLRHRRLPGHVQRQHAVRLHSLLQRRHVRGEEGQRLVVHE